MHGAETARDVFTAWRLTACAVGALRGAVIVSPPGPPARLVADPTLHPLFHSLIFVLAGLAGRALTDKLLVLVGGAEAVAAWAQVMSVADVVSGVSLTGIGIAVTVLAASHTGEGRRYWLKAALLMCLALSCCAAILGGFLAPNFVLLPGEGTLLYWALLAGWLAVGPGLLTAWLVGCGAVPRATLLTVAGLATPLVLLLTSPFPSPLQNLLAGQVLFGLVVLAGLGLGLRGLPPVTREHVVRLGRFLPMGIAIGTLGSAALAWSRGEIGAHHSWQTAGQVQAIWRTTDWVTAIMAGVLNAHFLPRLSAAPDRSSFLRELRRSAAFTALPAAGLLLALWLVLPDALALLYRDELRPARTDAFYFVAGDGVRILSWIALFGLYARHQAWAATVGEFLSLPLFALLLTLSAGAGGLRGIGVLWCLSYLAYAVFNAWALRRSLRPGQPWPLAGH